ncbi:MAG: hypothetical protein HQL69_23770 [Magnetococcales bacterium]|nr:hypothetical protein [Magnetococcales bacterium]
MKSERLVPLVDLNLYATDTSYSNHHMSNARGNKYPDPLPEEDENGAQSLILLGVLETFNNRVMVLEDRGYPFCSNANTM